MKRFVAFQASGSFCAQLKTCKGLCAQGKSLAYSVAKLRISCLSSMRPLVFFLIN